MNNGQKTIGSFGDSRWLIRTTAHSPIVSVSKDAERAIDNWSEATNASRIKVAKLSRTDDVRDLVDIVVEPFIVLHQEFHFGYT